MIGHWLKARQARKNCFHHDHRTGESWIASRLIDVGARKMFWCIKCNQTWIV
jgi:hypothetical protein